MKYPNRLAEIRKGTEHTQDTAAVAMGMSLGGYRKLEYGERRLKLEQIKAAASAFGVQPSDIVDPKVTILDIVGRVGASTDGEIIQDTDQGPFAQIEAPIGASGDEAVVEVSGHSMGIYAPDGSLILYDSRHNPPHEDMLGEVCVVGLPDGRILVKRLLRGSKRGLFDLESLVGDTLRDQRVEWAAVVQIVVHPRHARRLRIEP
jgi:transcriptional regulator with XRE-family HTH domain